MNRSPVPVFAAIVVAALAACGNSVPAKSASEGGGEQGHPWILARGLPHKSRGHHGNEQPCERRINHNVNPFHAAARFSNSGSQASG